MKKSVLLLLVFFVLATAPVCTFAMSQANEPIQLGTNVKTTFISALKRLKSLAADMEKLNPADMEQKTQELLALTQETVALAEQNAIVLGLSYADIAGLKDCQAAAPRQIIAHCGQLQRVISPSRVGQWFKDLAIVGGVLLGWYSRYREYKNIADMRHALSDMNLNLNMIDLKNTSNGLTALVNVSQNGFTFKGLFSNIYTFLNSKYHDIIPNLVNIQKKLRDVVSYPSTK